METVVVVLFIAVFLSMAGYGYRLQRRYWKGR